MEAAVETAAVETVAAALATSAAQFGSVAAGRRMLVVVIVLLLLLTWLLLLLLLLLREREWSHVDCTVANTAAARTAVTCATAERRAAEYEPPAAMATWRSVVWVSLARPLAANVRPRRQRGVA